MKPTISIKFPMRKERTGRRTGPRFRLVPDKAGLHGAAFCAAGMVGLALSHRERRPYSSASDTPRFHRIERLQMRLAALWARVFAGQIDQHDPRLDAAQGQISALIHEGYAYIANAA